MKINSTVSNVGKMWRRMKTEFTYYQNHIYSFRYRGNRIAKVLTVTNERPGFRFE